MCVCSYHFHSAGYVVCGYGSQWGTCEGIVKEWHFSSYNHCFFFSLCSYTVSFANVIMLIKQQVDIMLVLAYQSEFIV